METTSNATATKNLVITGNKKEYQLRNKVYRHIWSKCNNKNNEDSFDFSHSLYLIPLAISRYLFAINFSNAKETFSFLNLLSLETFNDIFNIFCVLTFHDVS